MHRCETTTPLFSTIVDPPYVWNQIVYNKGAWVVHMLRWILGGPDFFQFLLDYREKPGAFRWGGARHCGNWQ